MDTRWSTWGVWGAVVCLAMLCGGPLGGCVTEKSAYEEAVDVGTSDAMRDFLERYPDGMYAAKARPDLDELQWSEAVADGSADALEQYLADHPEGIHLQEATIAAPKAAWKEMDEANDAAAIEAFLERYPTSAYAPQARQRLALLQKVPRHLSLGEPGLEPSESGGWVITFPVENTGEVDVLECSFRVAFTGEDGGVVAETEASLVSRASAEDEGDDPRRQPLRPGERRVLTYDLAPQLEPAGWAGDAQHVRLVPASLVVEG